MYLKFGSISVALCRECWKFLSRLSEVNESGEIPRTWEDKAVHKLLYTSKLSCIVYYNYYNRLNNVHWDILSIKIKLVKCEDKNDIFTAHSKDIVNTSSHLRIPGSLFSEYEKTWYFIERVYENVVKTSSRNKRKQLILWYTVRTFENTEFKNNQQRTRSSEFGRYSEAE